MDFFCLVLVCVCVCMFCFMFVYIGIGFAGFVLEKGLIHVYEKRFGRVLKAAFEGLSEFDPT